MTEPPAAAAAPVASPPAEDIILQPLSKEPETIPPAEEEPTEPDDVRIARALKLKEEGNTHYGAGELERAIDCYSEALRISPKNSADRATYYGNRAMCYLKKANYELCIKDCSSALEIAPNHLKCLQRRAIANEQLKKYKEAEEDFASILKLDPGNVEAKKAVATLPEKAQRYEEEQKAEAMGKLKEVGNSLLGLFGMSTDNFKFTQDPKTGGYSISIQK